MDKGEVTTLTLLDLSAAFDTIDHATLTDILSDWYGISGQAQIWLFFYLLNRHQSVKIKDTLSDKVTLIRSSTGLCARTSDFYFIHYTTQRYYL